MNEFPILANAAFSHLTTPATSVDCQQLSRLVQLGAFLQLVLSLCNPIKLAVQPSNASYLVSVWWLNQPEARIQIIK